MGKKNKFVVSFGLLKFFYRCKKINFILIYNEGLFCFFRLSSPIDYQFYESRLSCLFEPSTGPGGQIFHWVHKWLWVLGGFFVFFFFLFFFLLFRAKPTAYGCSQARGWIRAATASLHHSYSNLGSMSATYTTAHSNARSPTHWARPGIKPESSWTLVRFNICWAKTGIHVIFNDCVFFISTFVYQHFCLTRNDKASLFDQTNQAPLSPVLD